MSYAQDNGYTPVPFDDIISAIRVGINTQFGTTYTEESFLGTNWYKYAYAIAQKISEGETKTSEIFVKLQEYIETTNERIQRPSVSHPGLLDSFEDEGFVASVKQPLEADAGKIFICVDLDNTALDYAAKKLQVCTLIKDFVAAGLVTMGTETESIVLSNGQSFDFKFYLPNLIPVLLRLTAVESNNQLIATPTDEEIRIALFANIQDRYRLGWDFEPERYYTIAEALWASDVTLEWSSNAGATWNSTVYTADFDDLFDFGLEDIAVVIT